MRTTSTLNQNCAPATRRVQRVVWIAQARARRPRVNNPTPTYLLGEKCQNPSRFA